MGRDHNLPSIFARVHPVRHTPHWAVFFSGCLMILMSWLLPIEDVAAAADIMFLLLFLQVNLTVMTLRHKMPDLDRGYRIPWFPIIPLIAIGCNGVLAIQLFQFSQVAWYFAIGWLIIGLLAYYGFFSKIEAMEKPKDVLHEEVLVSRDYSVLVPVATQEQARILGKIGAVLAQDNAGEVLACHVVKVPPQLTLGEGRLMLTEGRPYLETVIAQAKERDVPVHTMIRLGRNVAESLRKTAIENASDLIVLGWPGYTNTASRLYGSVIDPIVDNPPTDIAIVRYRQFRPLHSILVPVSEGPNSRRAVRMAVQMARAGHNGPVKVVLLHVVPVGARNATLVRARQCLDYVVEGSIYEHIEKRMVEGTDVVDTIIRETEQGNYDLVIVGSTEEPLFKNLLMGSVSGLIAKRSPVTVVMVKRRSSPLHSFLRQTVLEPSTGSNGKRSEEKETVI
jgi:nucleotide-binding universal stress UspA family protein